MTFTFGFTFHGKKKTKNKNIGMVKIVITKEEQVSIL